MVRWDFRRVFVGLFLTAGILVLWYQPCSYRGISSGSLWVSLSFGVEPSSVLQPEILKRQSRPIFFLSPAPSPIPASNSLKKSGTNGSQSIPSAELDLFSSTASAQKYNGIEQLAAAKNAIKNGPFSPPEQSLHPSIYHNVSAFQKSYELMEQMFKIYVYEEGEKPLIHDGPLTGIYSSEGHFIHRMMKKNNPFVETDPAKAHAFFLPYSVSNMVDHLYVPGSKSMRPLNTFIKNYVTMLSAKYPFWNNSHGRDHFFVSCHDWGPLTVLDHPELERNAMEVVCNADLSGGFKQQKDASLPEIYLHEQKLPSPKLLGGPGPTERPILAFFAGQMHGRVRPILLNYWQSKDPDMKIYKVLPKQIARNMSYEMHMKSSKFCICPMGYEVNSPRIVESIYSDCVPVIIADNFALPFGDVINWNSFSVTVLEKDIPNLKNILMAVSDSRYRLMQRRLAAVRQHFVWHEEFTRYDVFSMILHSVWIRRLNLVQ